jgi:hypothetical protein
VIRSFLVTLGVLALLSASAAALTLDALPGWTTGENLDKAVEVAKKKECPIALLHAPQEGGAEVVMSRVYMKLPCLDGMVKVLVYDAARLPTTFRKVAGQVQAPGEGLPVLYVATPDLKIIGFIEKGGHKKTGGRVAEVAWATWNWIKKSRRDIDAAEKGAQAGRFGTLLKTYRRIQDEQKECVVEVTKTWNVILTKDETKPIYFPELSQKIDGVPSMAEAHLEKAKEAFDKKDWAEARKLLGPMAADKCDLEAWNRAVALQAKVEEEAKK